MSGPDQAAAPAIAEPALVAALVALDPIGSGGVVLRAAAGPVRERWLAMMRDLLPPGQPVRRVPLGIADDRLLGGLDLVATLAAGRPILARGLLAEADGCLLLLAMAERLSAATALKLAAVLDTGLVRLERDGLMDCRPARLGLVALDEGAGEDEQVPAALQDRLAFRLDLTGYGWQAPLGEPPAAVALAAARAALPTVAAEDAIIEALCAAAWHLGIGSLRPPLLALRVARGLAALAGRSSVSTADAAVAARLVLAPRATALPVEADADATPPEPPAPPDQPPDQPPPAEDAADPAEEPVPTPPLEELILAAAAAAIPPGLLAQLQAAPGQPSRARSAGRSSTAQRAGSRGRPAGTRPGLPGANARLDLLATLRAAAPWQRLRQPASATGPAASRPRIQVRKADLRVTRYRQRAQTTTIFVVDASGSAALHRLAEAKGAIELLLADCYVRRDQVALLAFRGQGAELLLPPTRSLVRAKRSLACLPGGGGTPLAAGIDAAAALAEAIRRKGETPVLILLTDGRANIARAGQPGRALAEAHALAAAQAVRAAGLTTLLVDTAPQPRPPTRALAAAMAARYLALPYADAQALSQAVRASAPSARAAALA